MTFLTFFNEDFSFNTLNIFLLVSEDHSKYPLIQVEAINWPYNHTCANTPQIKLIKIVVDSYVLLEKGAIGWYFFLIFLLPILYQIFVYSERETCIKSQWAAYRMIELVAVIHDWQQIRSDLIWKLCSTNHCIGNNPCELKHQKSIGTVVPFDLK